VNFTFTLVYFISINS